MSLKEKKGSGDKRKRREAEIKVLRFFGKFLKWMKKRYVTGMAKGYHLYTLLDLESRGTFL